MFSMVADVAAKRMWVTAGNPCQSEYVQSSISPSWLRDLGTAPGHGEATNLNYPPGGGACYTDPLATEVRPGYDSHVATGHRYGTTERGHTLVGQSRTRQREARMSRVTRTRRTKRLVDHHHLGGVIASTVFAQSTTPLRIRHSASQRRTRSSSRSRTRAHRTHSTRWSVTSGPTTPCGPSRTTSRSTCVPQDFSPDFDHSLVTSVDASHDGMTVHVPLPPGVKWSDGQPFSSEDAAWTLNYYKENNVPNYSSDLALMDKATATDRHHDGHDQQEADLLLLRRVGLPVRVPPPQAHLEQVPERLQEAVTSRHGDARRSAPARSSSRST